MPEPTRPRCAVLPADRGRALTTAVEEGGGEVVDVSRAEALIWVDPRDPGQLPELLAAHPDIRWVQLPFAGIEPFADLLDDDHVWTSGKGVYAEPVAEHALALALGGMRGVGRYARHTAWSEPYGRNLLGATVAILGGGSITTSLLRLLAPFETRTTVVRRRKAPIDGADAVVGLDRLTDILGGCDLVVLALALTPETEHVVDAQALESLRDHAWLVNVARGRHVDTDALVAALRDGRIGGAALDVTDPEPLPDDHPLWRLDNCIVTPHVANTPEMGGPLLRARIRDNVARYATGQELLGRVDARLGY